MNYGTACEAGKYGIGGVERSDSGNLSEGRTVLHY
jgi:hypothetical protein